MATLILFTYYTDENKKRIFKRISPTYALKLLAKWGKRVTSWLFISSEWVISSGELPCRKICNGAWNKGCTKCIQSGLGDKQATIEDGKVIWKAIN